MLPTKTEDPDIFVVLTVDPRAIDRGIAININNEAAVEQLPIPKTMSSAEADLPPAQGTRHTLSAEEELRLEVPFLKQSTCTILLQKGSCELWGLELVQGKPHILTDGAFKLAFFTWHGCVIDIECENIDIAYTTDETNCNIAYVNTHAQLEALRDQAASSSAEGPRVLICGPTDSGKTSLLKTLTAYACKLGRTPMVVDLDTNDNTLSIPGTVSACPLTFDALSFETHALTGVPPGTASSLVLWHGSASQLTKELWKAQVTALASKIQQRAKEDAHERASGMIVNTSGSMQADGLDLLLHAIHALSITVVLVMGHDRLYSMLKSKVDTDAIKLIKLPRSGGVVSRESSFLRQSRIRSIKRYFYGGLVETPNASKRVPELTPFLLQLPKDQITVYKFTSISLSASLLPVAAAQTSEAVQVEEINLQDDSASGALQHHLMAVCHPRAVAAYNQSGQASDLYLAGVAGFCSVERVVDDRIHLLSPCAGSLPSNVLLTGDVTWME